MRFFLLVTSFWLVTTSLQAKIVFYSFRDGNTEIYTMDADGNNQTRLTFNEASDSAPVWSPNGRQIVFHSKRDGNWEIYVMDADGNNQHNLTNHPALDSKPEWSPDGSQIAFDSTRGAEKGERKLEIYVMDADGSNVKQVTDVGFASRPRWSPDGQWILFEAHVEGIVNQGRQIYAIRPDGTDLWQVSTPREGTGMIAGGWSRDGRQVLYTEAIGFDPDTSFPVIATLSKKGHQEVIHWEHIKVPRMPFDTASFSADGQSILFSGKKEDGWNIYRFELSGHQLIQLTDNLAEDTMPREWNPRLSVSLKRETLPQTWGRIKTKAMSK